MGCSRIYCNCGDALILYRCRARRASRVVGVSALLVRTKGRNVAEMPTSEIDFTSCKELNPFST